MLKRKDDHVLRRALEFEVEGQRKKKKSKKHGIWKKQVEVENVSWLEQGRCTLLFKKIFCINQNTTRWDESSHRHLLWIPLI